MPNEVRVLSEETMARKREISLGRIYVLLHAYTPSTLVISLLVYETPFCNIFDARDPFSVSESDLKSYLHTGFDQESCRTRVIISVRRKAIGT